MTSRRRRDRDPSSDRRISLRGGGMVRRKRRPASRDGGYLRSERRAGGGEPGEGRAGDRDLAPETATTSRDAPEVELRRRGGTRPAPVAGITTLGTLLLLVLALIFLL